MCKIFVEKYNNLSDNDLIDLLRSNDQDAFEVLFSRYMPLLKSIVSKNCGRAGDFDDLFQDATISFYYAAHMFDFHSASFSTFLSICVERSLKSTIRKASAKKRIPESLIVPIEQSDQNVLKTRSAEETYFEIENSTELSSRFNEKLSALELKVLSSFLVTSSYDKTAKELGLTRKSVDNALLRVRRKLNS